MIEGWFGCLSLGSGVKQQTKVLMIEGNLKYFALKPSSHRQLEEFCVHSVFRNYKS